MLRASVRSRRFSLAACIVAHAGGTLSILRTVGMNPKRLLLVVGVLKPKQISRLHESLPAVRATRPPKRLVVVRSVESLPQLLNETDHTIVEMSLQTPISSSGL